MTNRFGTDRTVGRCIGLAVLGLFLVTGSRPARAYFPIKTSTGNRAAWQGGSNPGIFANNTLTWQFYTGNFPIGNAPPVDDAGAAFQHAFESHNDVVGDTIRFLRAPNTATAPAMRDGLLTMAYVTNQTSDFYGTDITGANAVTYTDYDDPSGVMQDADLFLNSDPARPPGGWSTTGAANTTDSQVTSTHEAMHVLGAGHTPYFGARVYPVARSPIVLLPDRCMSPDDKAYHREVYAAATLQGGLISGTVNLSAPAGTPCNKAVVVATDANGIPQAITATSAAGTYTLNVPAGTYSLTVFNGYNSEYFPTGRTDLDFGAQAAIPGVRPATPAASDFISATTVTGVVVTDGSAPGAATIVATSPAGAVPSLWLRRQSLSPAQPALQVVYLDPGTTGTISLQIDNSRNTANPIPSATQITGITIGTGLAGDIAIAPNSWSTAAGAVLQGGGQTTIITVPVTVPAAAIPGFRNLLIQTNLNSNERLFLPGVVKVNGKGGLIVSTPAAGNPVTATHPFGTTDVPLLRVQFQAVAPAAPAVNNEDIRLRRLSFDIAGTGPTLPSVKLWIDGATPGVVDPGVDTRVFSGGAYANPTVSESLPLTPSGTITFDNIVVSVLAGQTINLLLTADMAASGSGDYSASFNPASGVTAHGMFWGDPVTPSGSSVIGTTQSLGAMAITNLSQIRTTGGANIPVGGYTPETQVTCRGTATSASGTVGIEVEVKPLGTAFDGASTVSSANTFASGSLVAVNVPGLTNLTSYHWRARAISPTLAPSPWVVFGANSESAVDFSVDSSTTSPPSALQQLEIDGVTTVPIGGLVHGALVFSATNGTDSLGQSVRLEVEVQPTGTAFTNAPSVTSGYVPSGAATTVLFSGAPTNDYHWQARTVDAFGVASTWVNFNAAAIHFHMEAIVEIKAQAGCAGSTALLGSDALGVWATVGLLLLLLSLKRRSAAATVGVLLLAAGLSSTAGADEEVAPLPRSLSEGFPAAPAEIPLMSTEPVRAPGTNWVSFDGYLGALFMDFSFDALGTDFVRRQVSGIGTGVAGVEGMVYLTGDWRLGMAAEADLYSDIRILAVGPVGMWRFAGSHRNGMSGMSDNEHFLKLALFYEDLTITKKNFGSFDATFGVRLGYEMHLTLNEGWAVTLGAAFQYSQWNYSPSIRSGDDKIGGFGGLISIGIAWLP